MEYDPGGSPGATVQRFHMFPCFVGVRAFVRVIVRPSFDNFGLLGKRSGSIRKRDYFGYENLII